MLACEIRRHQVIHTHTHEPSIRRTAVPAQETAQSRRRQTKLPNGLGTPLARRSEAKSRRPPLLPMHALSCADSQDFSPRSLIPDEDRRFTSNPGAHSSPHYSKRRPFARMTDLAQSTRLPMDVIYDIIGQLATPHNQDAFVHEPDVVAALCSLCLVRRDVHRWSVRQLYSRISITSDSQLTLLLATGMPHRSFIRSLHLEGFGAKLDSESIARLLLIVGRVVERLMVDIMDVVVLIYLLETSPGRQGTLSLRSPDGPWVHVDDFGGMPALQEVVFSAISDARISFPEPCPTLSERWPNLRRLAFYGDFYNTTNLFKGLEVLIFTWDSDTSIEMVHQIIENHPALQRLVFLIPNVWAWWYAHKISTSEKRAIAEAHLGRLSILEIYHPHKEEIAKRSGANHSWFAEHCRGGTLWELSGQEWLSLE